MKDYESVAFHIANLLKKQVKQNKRNSAHDKYIEEAKQKSKQWWDKIKENAIKNIDQAAELEQQVRDSVNNGS